MTSLDLADGDGNNSNGNGNDGNGNSVTWSKIMKTEEEYVEYLNWVAQSESHGSPYPQDFPPDRARMMLAEIAERNNPYGPTDTCLRYCRYCKNFHRRCADDFKRLYANVRLTRLTESVGVQALVAAQCSACYKNIECVPYESELAETYGGSLGAQVSKSFDHTMSETIHTDALSLHRQNCLFEPPVGPNTKFQYRSKGWADIYQVLYHIIRQEVDNESREAVQRDGSILDVRFEKKSARRILKSFWRRLQQTESLCNVFRSNESPSTDDFRSIYSMELVRESMKLFRQTLNGTVMPDVTVSFFAPPLFTNFNPGVKAKAGGCEQSLPSRFERIALNWMSVSREASPDLLRISKIHLKLKQPADEHAVETEVVHHLLERHKAEHMNFRAHFVRPRDREMIDSNDVGLFFAVSSGEKTVAYGSASILKNLFNQAQKKLKDANRQGGGGVKEGGGDDDDDEEEGQTASGFQGRTLALSLERQPPEEELSDLSSITSKYNDIDAVGYSGKTAVYGSTSVKPSMKTKSAKARSNPNRKDDGVEVDHDNGANSHSYSHSQGGGGGGVKARDGDEKGGPSGIPGHHGFRHPRSSVEKQPPNDGSNNTSSGRPFAKEEEEEAYAKHTHGNGNGTGNGNGNGIGNARPPKIAHTTAEVVSRTDGTRRAERGGATHNTEEKEIQLTQEEEESLKVWYEQNKTGGVEEGVQALLKARDVSLLDEVDIKEVFARRTTSTLFPELIDPELREFFAAEKGCTEEDLDMMTKPMVVHDLEFFDATGWSARDLMTKPAFEALRRCAIVEKKSLNLPSHRNSVVILRHLTLQTVRHMKHSVANKWVEIEVRRTMEARANMAVGAAGRRREVGRRHAATRQEVHDNDESDNNNNNNHDVDGDDGDDTNAERNNSGHDANIQEGGDVKEGGDDDDEDEGEEGYEEEEGRSGFHISLQSNWSFETQEQGSAAGQGLEASRKKRKLAAPDCEPEAAVPPAATSLAAAPPPPVPAPAGPPATSLEEKLDSGGVEGDGSDGSLAGTQPKDDVDGGGPLPPPVPASIVGGGIGPGVGMDRDGGAVSGERDIDVGHESRGKDRAVEGALQDADVMTGDDNVDASVGKSQQQSRNTEATENNGSVSSAGGDEDGDCKIQAVRTTDPNNSEGGGRPQLSGTVDKRDEKKDDTQHTSSRRPIAEETEEGAKHSKQSTDRAGGKSHRSQNKKGVSSASTLKDDGIEQERDGDAGNDKCDKKLSLKEARALATEKACAGAQFIPLTIGTKHIRQVSRKKQEVWVESETDDENGIRVSVSDPCISVIFSLETIIFSSFKKNGMTAIRLSGNDGLVQLPDLGKFLHSSLRQICFDRPSAGHMKKVLAHMNINLRKQEHKSKVFILAHDKGCCLAELELLGSHSGEREWVCYLADHKLLVSNNHKITSGENGAEQGPLKIPDVARRFMKNGVEGLTSKLQDELVRAKIADHFFELVLQGRQSKIRSLYKIDI